jgi:hypothetical protein|tara:strand:- start:1760 stop:2209 length:450 start_codon:yes stop_codon:yes gene_type:complete
MNEVIVNADGTTTTVGDAGSVSGILAELVKANTVPAERDADGVITKEEVVPAADTLAVEITADDLKTHAWRVPKARVERLEDIRGARNAKLDLIDVEIDKAAKNQPGYSRTVANSEVEKQALRDLPPAAESHLAGLNDTDAITAYDPLA